MKNHLNSLKFKPNMKEGIASQDPNAQILAILANQQKNNARNSQSSKSQQQIKPSDRASNGILSNKALEELQQREFGKQKNQKINAYQKQIKELYKPKVSERKAFELEQLNK